MSADIIETAAMMAADAAAEAARQSAIMADAWRESDADRRAAAAARLVELCEIARRAATSAAASIGPACDGRTCSIVDADAATQYAARDGAALAIRAEAVRQLAGVCVAFHRAAVLEFPENFRN